MAAKRTGKQSLKIIAATSMVIFSLFTVFSGTIAWFTAVRHTANDSNNFKVDKYDRLLKVSYHQFTGTPNVSSSSFNKTPYASITYNSATKTFDSPKNGSGTTIDGFNLEMDYYDPMNKNKPVLILAELNSEYDITTDGNIEVLARTNTADFMGAKDANHQPRYNLGGTSPTLRIKQGQKTVDTKEVTVDYYPLSSVISFKSFSMSADDYDDWSSGSTFDVSTSNTIQPHRNFAEADTDADSSSFVQTCNIFKSTPEAFDSNEKYKVNEYVSYDGNYYRCTTAVNDAGDWTGKTNWAVVSINTRIKYLAIICDYNDAAIEYIYSAYLGDHVLEGTYEYFLNFICDWVWEIG